MAVFVLDKQNKPLMPCTEKRARLLLERGRAVVVRLAPFTVRLKDRIGGATQPLRIKLDPGSKITGIALVREAEIIDPETGEITRTDHVLWLGELAHALDAVCVGAVDQVHDWNRPTLAIKATGRGSYQRTRLDRFGFPRGYLMRQKRVHGFQTGDWVIAQVPKGKKTGTHVGRVAVRASGSFNIQTATGVMQGISHRYCQVLQRADGYGYTFNPTPTEEARRAA